METLEYVTPSKNAVHAIGKSVSQYSREGIFIASYRSITEASEAVGVTKSNNFVLAVTVELKQIKAIYGDTIKTSRCDLFQYDNYFIK